MKEGVLTVGIDPSYPPFALDEAGILTGLDVDLAGALAENLGLRTKFVYFGYDGLYDALGTGQVDVLISALVVAPERTKDFSFSTSYFNAGQILIVSDSSDVQTVDDLGNHALAVELGAEGHVVATKLQRQVPHLRIVPFNSVEEGLSAVVAGDVDAALVDSIGGRLFLTGEPSLRLTREALTQEPFALVVREKDTQLLRRLNDSLRELEANGGLNDIVSRWLG